MSLVFPLSLLVDGSVGLQSKIRDSPRADKEPLELSLGPITRAQTKSFKEAVSDLVDQLWGETIVGHIECSWTSSPSMPCNLL
ncbi:hypothetical protein PVK06_040191 [Gossypium arboreum]|uniref:Uncharacterized protein n=1 Tax=Gossypium arboreum TaxID=29729 RepID=A0ABR0N5E6_GOSAR|nr:hypothetical protein PVK06_040191 [Gossypium arboreum]